MHPRFGMTQIAIQTAEARQREAQLRQPDNPVVGNPPTANHLSHDDASALWRMGAVILLVAILAGTIAGLATAQIPVGSL